MSGLILASGSPRRRALLGTLGRRFEVLAADVDERALPGESPEAHVRRLARAKAEAVAARATGAVIVGADTIVVVDGTILGKPEGPDEARRMLGRLRRRRHLVLTGVAVVDAATGRTLDAVATTGVWLRAYTDAEVDAYVATGDPLDKAGAYAIQHPTFDPVAWLEGSEANVIGLPLALVESLLDRLARSG